MPNDLEGFAQLQDPEEIAAITAKLQRYIARGHWAQQALQRLHAARASKPPAARPPPDDTSGGGR